MNKHGIVILQDKEQKCEEIKRAFEQTDEFEHERLRRIERFEEIERIMKNEECEADERMRIMKNH